MSKPGADPSSGISLVDVLIPTERHPACRQRESRSGSCTERENLAGDAKGKGTSGANREAESTDAPERGGLPRSVCLTVDASGGFKSRSARGPGPISEGGGNASPARAEDERYGEATKAQRRKPGNGYADLEPHRRFSLEGRAPAVRWGPKGLRRTTGS
jgi:hypothetical protein